MNTYICFAKSENVLAFNLTECFFLYSFLRPLIFIHLFIFFGNILLEAAVTLGL